MQKTEIEWSNYFNQPKTSDNRLVHEELELVDPPYKLATSNSITPQNAAPGFVAETSTFSDLDSFSLTDANGNYRIIRKIRFLCDERTRWS